MFANWIGGEWCAARAGGTFTPGAALRRAADPAPSEIAWPRSSEADVRAAIAVLESSRESWSAVSAHERRTIASVACPCEVLSGTPRDYPVEGVRELPIEGASRLRWTTWVQTFERRLGLVYDEDRGNADIDALHLADAARCATLDALPLPPASRGIACVRVHWSELFAGVYNAVAPLVAAGRVVLLLSDPHAPELAARVALAFADAGLPPGVLALVHDDSGACLEAAARDERVTSFHVSGPASVARPLERRLVARRKPEFGAGLDDTHVLRVPRSRTFVVTRDDDIAAAATTVIQAAFGRGNALSGQAPRCVGRVLCHERVFSRFTAELLAGLAVSRDVREPLPLLERELESDARRMYELGLDEGATPIFTAAESAGGDARFLFPIVFTNVEEHMRLARISRPAPVLRLMRCASDERAQSAAAEFERHTETEDLSGAAAPAGKGLAAARAGAQDRSPGGR